MRGEIFGRVVTSESTASGLGETRVSFEIRLRSSECAFAQGCQCMVHDVDDIDESNKGLFLDIEYWHAQNIVVNESLRPKERMIALKRLITIVHSIQMLP